ncbi:alpha/beta hydrolase [Lysobacter korlensis]|uniref:Alpha/beta hydrolase n=1 Tax=Lysobacter korlensis TaxID=553636 RepID=A0ABV6RY06_9GAMM
MSPRKTALPVPPPIVFVHGMWLHAASWQNWVDLFAAEGFDASAPAWPGERPTVAASRADTAGIGGLTMDRLVSSYASLIRDMPVQPVLIGHSLGGTVVQTLLTAGYGAAGVILDSARFDGDLPGALSTLRLGLPRLTDPRSVDDAIALTDYQFRFAFGRSLDAAESDAYYREFAIPAPARLLLEPEIAGIDLPAAPGPKGKPTAALLTLESAGPAAGSLGRRRLYDGPDSDAQPIRFPDRGASFVFDEGWRDVAECALDWVQDRFGSVKTAAGAHRRRGVALRGTAA